MNNRLDEVVTPGIQLGDGNRTYTVEKVTKESIYLRGHPEGQRSETRLGRGALRILPRVVIDDIINAIDMGVITLDDINRKYRSEKNLPPLFTALNVDHDPFILGYDSTIYKLCEFYFKKRISVISKDDINRFAIIPFEHTSYINMLAGSRIKLSEKLVLRFITSIITKPFVLLSGLSGSGKTKLAHSFALWICQNDGYKVNEEFIEITLPINKSAIEHNGWTLPKDYNKKNSIESEQVKVIIDGKIIDGSIDSSHRLFYDKRFNLSDKYKIGDEVLVKIKLKPTISNQNQFCLIPVGADWTNREPLLGYPNALEKGKYVKPDNGVLDLLINANKEIDLPFFLILDEMNLSHVERYFADFLSVMETGGTIPLHPDTDEWKDADGNWKDGVPDKISMPSNLFIIGTVNIDETTYMFSPKVLDRANVIEFRVTEKEIEEFLDNPVKPDLDVLRGAGAGMASDFVRLARENITDFHDQDVIKQSLVEFFKELKKTGSEFGYRTSSEIFRFAGILRNLTEAEGKPWATDDIIDAAVLQKLLPKIHGSKKKLEKVLPTLGQLCLLKDIEDPDKLFKSLFDNPDLIDADENKDKIRFKRSLEKILRMKRRADQDGFTSFAEA